MNRAFGQRKNSIIISIFTLMDLPLPEVAITIALPLDVYKRQRYVWLLSEG